MSADNNAHTLPQNWCWTTLRDIATRITDGTHQPPKFVPEGVPFIFVKHIVGGVISFNETRFVSDQTYQELNGRCPVELGDTLYSAVGSYGVAVPVMTNERFSFQRHIAHIKPTLALRQRYLAWCLNSPACVAQAHATARGVAQKTVTLGELAKFRIPLAPPAEQERIVAAVEQHLSDIDAGVAALRRTLAHLKRYRAAVLKAACEGRLVPTEAALAKKEKRDYEPADLLLKRILRDRRARWEADQLAKMAARGQTPKDDKWKAKYEEPAPPDLEGLTVLPGGWRWIALGSVIGAIEAGASFKCDERRPNENEVGVVKVSAVTWGEYDQDETKTCTDPSRVDPELFVSPGDFLFSRANTIELVGACVIAKNVTRSAMLSDKILRFRLVELEPFWVLYMLRSRFGRDEIERLATGNQDSMRNIGQERIRQIRIPLPPLAEQHRIVAEVDRLLSTADETEQTVRAQLARAARLRQSVLKRAFEGKLVPQDPNDEPATVLLERIRAQKAADAETKPSKPAARGRRT